MPHQVIVSVTPTIMSGRVVRFELGNGNFEINASRDGVGVMGSRIFNLDGLRGLRMLLSVCEAHHESMARRNEPPTAQQIVELINAGTEAHGLLAEVESKRFP